MEVTESRRPDMYRLRVRKLLMLPIILFLTAMFLCFLSSAASAESLADNLSNDIFEIQTGTHGEITSLKLKGDVFPTEYVMNPTNAPNQNTPDHQWLGELMFTYKLGSGEWTKAWTSKSDDGRTITKSGDEITVTYENASNSEGIRNFKVIEKYALVDDYVKWTIAVENTSNQTLEIGDLGLPLPFNELWQAPNDRIYETRVLNHSFVGNNSSYITIQRPSGIGPSMLLVPDAATGAGFEYQDRWKQEEHPGSNWTNDTAGWVEGLNVYYIHSNVIKSTNKGYLPNTSLILAPNESKSYAFKFFKTADDNDVKAKLYDEGLVDVTVVPGMIFATNMKAKIDLHTFKDITSVTAQYPSETTVTYLNTAHANHKIYELTLGHLGQNDITVQYGNGEKTVLQFYAIEPIDAALQRHSTFMVEKTQYNDPGSIRDKVFDDWMMQNKTTRNRFNGYWGWGDDWGLTHGQFLAEKNSQVPVASEVKAVDDYLETAVWTNLMNGHHEDYLVPDFLMNQPNTTPTYRGYAYPHIYNTYFSMYKIAKMYPDLVPYKHTKEEYLLRTYNIFKALYDGPVAYNWETGLMGELTTPDIIKALQDEGFTAEANDLIAKMATKYNNFKNTTYPYGSEYSYDNTGEEAVYTLAKMNNNTTMMSKIIAKTRADRGQMPIWYYYADPVTITGENWWNFQYSTSLAGYTMDDWIRHHSAAPEVEQRLSYAAKMANISAINSGQISSDPANIGASSWTYQAEKGNYGAMGLDGGPLFNGWRGMTGESDLGLFGAIKILSSDVAIDPIFGLTGYGADVTESGSNYVITPKDGVFKRINLITEKLNLELDRDQFVNATIAKSKNFVHLDMKNVTPGTPHQTKIAFTGLKKATYDIFVDGVHQVKLNAYGSQATLTINAGTAAAYTVELQEGIKDANTAPIVNAGADQSIILPDDISLKGTASDDDLPDGTLTAAWSLVSGPGTATFADAGALNTTATVSTAGDYVFKLQVSDSELSSEDTVKVTVAPAPPLPPVIVQYSFNETSGTTASDSTGNGMDGALKGSATWVQGKQDNGLQLNGTDSYVKMPAGILSRVHDITIATWVKANKLGNYARIFDFGSGTNTYMYLSPKVGGGGMKFGITTTGNGPGQEQVINAPALPTGVWKHVAFTLSGKTGILYVDGVQVGINTNITLDPSSLGKTINNYIGKSQFADPYLDGIVDDFRIYSSALSAADIASLAAPPFDDIVSLDEVNLTTQEKVAPKLPQTVTAHLKNASTIDVPVTWEAIDPARYASKGNAFTVTGTVVGSTTLKTTANIVVTGVQLDPFPSLVTRYKFDETNGSNVADASGNGHDGTTKGSLVWEPNGHQNGALTFSGTSGNYVDLGRSSDLQPSKVTLSYWIKRTASMGSNENILLWFKPENDYAANGFFVTYNGDVSSLVMVDGTGNFFVKSAPDDFLPLNEWTNVVFTFDSETKAAAIYKNGIAQEIDTDGDLNSITATSDIKKIGVSGYGNGAQLNATLDDFRIYNGAMTAKQVKALYDGKDVQSVQPVAVSTSIGTAPVLPDTVAIIYENASQGTADVSWDAIDPTKYAQSGTFQVNGKVDGTSIKAVANVTVKSPIPATRAVLTPSQPDGRNGWYIHPVTVNLIADNQSGGILTKYNLDGGGTWQTYTGPITMNQDGKYNLSYRSSDNAGNVEAVKTVSFNLDVVAPTIGISGLVENSNLGDAGDISPMFSLNDGMSGVDNSRTTVTLDTYSFRVGTTIPLYMLPLGSHTFHVVSSDLAGNTASATVTFQTTTSVDALKALVIRFTKNNWIDNAGIANSLQKKLDKGNVESFVSEVQAQAGKHVSSEAATYLLRDAQALINKK